MAGALVCALVVAGQLFAAAAGAFAAANDGCTITGTSAADVLVGTSDDDVVCSFGGNDVLRGGDGDDLLKGGGGNDRLRGGAGTDTLRGGLGSDLLRGGGDNDRLRAGAGTDTLRGGTGSDLLRGYKGVDRLRGGAGDDRLYGGSGGDTLDGRDAASFVDRLFCGSGSDRVLADTGDQVAAGCENVAQNHAPTDLTLNDASVAENEPVFTTVGTLSATDPDAGDTHAYSLVGGAGDADNASFTVAGSALRTNAVFDYETKSSFSVRIRVTDNAGASYEEQFTISVTDVAENATPVAVDDTFSTDEDTQLDLPVSAPGSPAENDTDPDGDPLTVTAASNASGGSVSIGGGEIHFVPALNLCGTGAGGFDYTVSDGQGGTDTGHVTVDVTCVDDPPAAVGDSATVLEDAAATAVDVLANDPDPDGGAKAIA
ncbi:MAG: Ig-like domain-containing protein, partial [Acidimicrobiia bacterium]